MDPYGGREPTQRQRATITAAKNYYGRLKMWLMQNLPDSDARKHALRELESSCMWATRGAFVERPPASYVVLTKTAFDPELACNEGWAHFHGNVVITCINKHQSTISPNSVDKDGRRRPSIACPWPDCGWHVEAKLQDWSPQPDS